MNRTAFGGGPAYLTFAALTFQMEDDWTATDQPTFFGIKTNLAGTDVDKRTQDALGKISCKPLGIVAGLSTMFAFQPSDVGKLLFPSTDRPAVVQTADGTSVTFKAAAISKPPDVTFSTTAPLFGGMELTYLRGSAGGFSTTAASAFSAPTLDPTNIITAAYTVTIGTTVVNVDEKGVVFSPSYNWTPRKTNNDGLLNYQLDSVTATAKFTPQDLTAAQYASLLSVLGSDVSPGTSMAGRAVTFTVNGGGTGAPALSIPKAYCSAGGLKFGKGGRISEITLTGLPNNGTLFTLA